MLVTAAAGLAALWALAGGSAAAVGLAGAAFVGLLAAVLLAWWRFGRRIVSLRELLGAPLYVLGKVPLYVRMLKARQVEWVRTKRDD